MTTTPQTEAMRLADAISEDMREWFDGTARFLMSMQRGRAIIAELRRLDAENKELKATQYGSGRLQALRDERDQLRAQVEQLKKRLFLALEGEETLAKAREKVDGVDRISPMDMSELLDVASANHAEAKALRAQVERLQGGDPVGRFDGDSNIESPFNACMHKGYCLQLKAAQPAVPAMVALPEFDSLPDEAIDDACAAGAFYRVDFMRAWEALRAHGIGQPAGGEG